MKLQAVLGRAADVAQLAFGALVLGPGLRRLEERFPGVRDAIRHEPSGARGEAFVERASTAEKAAFVAKILGTDGACLRFADASVLASDEVADELLLTGDLLFPGSLCGATLSERLRDRMSRAGAVVLNLEGTLGGVSQELAPLQTWRGLKQLLHYSRDAASAGWASRIGLDALEAMLAGLPTPVLSVANNHTLDDGPDGFDRTVSLARSLGAVVGDAREGHGAVVVAVGEHQAGLVAFSYGHNRLRVGAGLHLGFDGVPYSLDPERIERIAEELRERGATHLVALLHWGHEHEHEPTKAQRRCVDTLFDAGFSAVVGHHPHLLQTSEAIGGRAAFHSLGDFVGGDRTIWSRLGAMASLGLRPGGRVEASLVPIVQTPYWQAQRTMRLAEAPALERAVFEMFFCWKNRTGREEAP
jgi:hypothetical protein